MSSKVKLQVMTLGRWTGGAAIPLMIIVMLAGTAIAQEQSHDEPVALRSTDESPGRPAHPIELNDQQEQFLIELMTRQNPRMAGRLAELKQRDPDRFRQVLRRIAASERMRPLLMMARHDPQGARLRAAVMGAQIEAGRIRRKLDHQNDTADDDATPAEPAEATEQALRQAIGRLVDAELQLRAHELEKLEQRLDKLRSELRLRRDNREELIERHYTHLMENPPPVHPRRHRDEPK